MTVDEPQPPDSSRLIFESGFIDVYTDDRSRVVMVQMSHGVRIVTVMEARDARFLGRALLRRSLMRFRKQ